MSRIIAASCVALLFAPVSASAQRSERGPDSYIWIRADPRGGPHACQTGFTIALAGRRLADGTVDWVSSLTSLKGELPPPEELLDNGFSLCISRVPYIGVVDVGGIRITMRADGSQSIGRIPDTRTTRACCRPPVSVDVASGAPREPLCQDMPYPDTPTPSCEDARIVGGQWQAIDSSCETVTCAVEYQVCCYPETSGQSTCRERTPYDCQRSLGVVFPPGVACDDDPSPCAQPYRTCCSPTAGCARVRVDEACPWGGAEIAACADCPCQDPPCLEPLAGDETPEEDSGSCCLNGECVPDIAAESCILRGGEPCGPDNPCAPKVGACCPLEGPCRESTADTCTGTGESYLGLGVACPEVCPVRGACCLPDESGLAECHVLGEADCTEADGQFVMAGLSCAQIQCVPAEDPSIELEAPDEPGPCDAVLGSWPWMEGVTVDINRDGTAVSSSTSGIAFGSWECVDDRPTIRISWQAPQPFACQGVTTTSIIDTLSLIRDGNLQVLNGGNQCGDTFSVTRNEPVVVPPGLTCIWHDGGIHPSTCMCTDPSGVSTSAPHGWCPH